ncbi:MAG: non-canonical purine NTP pyrophosphatase [Candidatus Woesearchaeota archaeon]|nr:non-canonical purine NTP pyrophosphatase [Candidatus Woesearchaeota archaeon]
MKISFVTTNRHKFEEAKKVLSEFDIDLEWVNEELPEYEECIEEIAKQKARYAAKKLRKAVVVEDTGVFFEAYKIFPGPRPKFVFNSIGYEGIMRLLEGKMRRAFFKTAVGYCRPGKRPIVFSGIMKGRITKKVFDKNKDVMPYERIFVPENKKKTLSQMSREEKNLISHRAKAFRRLGRFLKKRVK